jgi:hypothetical protein
VKGFLGIWPFGRKTHHNLELILKKKFEDFFGFEGFKFN